MAQQAPPEDTEGLPPGMGLGAPVTRSRGVSPWAKVEEEVKGPSEKEQEKAQLKAKIVAIGGAIATIALLLVALFYIFGDSIPDILEGGEAEPIELDRVTQGEFSTMTNTVLYQFDLQQPHDLTITVRSNIDVYVEVRGDGDPVAQGVIHGELSTNENRNGELAASLQAGSYRLLIRPLRQGSGSFYVHIASGEDQTADQPTTPETLAPDA
jgi:hypothetical protein